MNFDDLIQKNLVTKKTYENGLSIYKYTRKVFFDNLWHLDDRLLNARGLVLDSNNKVVINPFSKVFNYKENGVTVDLEKEIIAVRKVNGFMAAMTLYKGELLFSSTGSLDSDYVKLAKYMILDTIKNKRLVIPGYTYLFEICHESDPHIVKEDAGVYLIGIRDSTIDSPLLSQRLLDEEAELFGFERPDWEVIKFKDVLYASSHVTHEGFMIHDLRGQALCKLKSTFYLNKKALQRCGKQKADAMFNNPEAFKEKLDEEFYSLFDKIITSFTKEQWLNLEEEERSEWIFNNLS